jgi:hypothetical protein
VVSAVSLAHYKGRLASILKPLRIMKIRVLFENVLS